MAKRNKHVLRLLVSVLVALAVIVVGVYSVAAEENIPQIVSERKISAESDAARDLRSQLEDEAITEIEINDTITIMDSLIVKGNKRLTGSGTIVFSQRAAAGRYADPSELSAQIGDEVVLSMDAANDLPTVLFVDAGADLAIGDHVIIDAANVGNGILVNGGGKVTFDGTAAVQNSVQFNLYNAGTANIYSGVFSASKGHNLVNASKMTVTGANIAGQELGAGIYNTGTLEVSDCEISDPETYGVYAASGTVKLTGGTFYGAKLGNIFAANGAKISYGKAVKNEKGAAGIINHGEFTIDGGTVEGNAVNVFNYGKMTADAAVFAKSAGNNFVNGNGGSVKFTNVKIEESVDQAIANMGTVEFSNLTVSGTGRQAVYNCGGAFNGTTLVLQDVLDVAFDNMDSPDGTPANASINGLKITNCTGWNLHQRSLGKVTVNSAIFEGTETDTVKLTSGDLVLGKATISGNNGNAAGILTVGGRLVMNDSEIKVSKGLGMNLIGGSVEGKNLKITETGQAIEVGQHDNGYSSAKVVLGEVTMTTIQRNSLVTSAKRADVTINGGTFGITNLNNVNIKLGDVTLNDVTVNGTKPAKDANYQDINLVDGHLTMNKCNLSGAEANTIRQSGGVLYVSDTFVGKAPMNGANCSAGTAYFVNTVFAASTKAPVNAAAAAATVTLDKCDIRGAGDKNNAVNCVNIAKGATVKIINGTKIHGSASLGAIGCQAGNLYINGAEIYGNATRGIALNKVTDAKTGVVSYSYAEIRNAKIHNNGNGTVSGGGIQNDGTLLIYDSEINGNSATIGGGINTGAGAKTSLFNVNIHNNSCKDAGGGLHISLDAIVKISGGKIHGNTAKVSGSAIRVNSEHTVFSNGAFIGVNNDVFLKSGVSIRVEENGLSNTPAKKMQVTLGSTAYGTKILECATEQAAIDYAAAVSVQGQEVSAHENTVILGNGNFDYVARVLNDDGTYTDYLSLDEALMAVPGNGKATRVELLQDITVSSKIEIPAKGNRNIILTTAEGSHTITRGVAGRMLILHTGNKLTIQGNGEDTLTFDGANLNAGADQQLIAVGTGAAARDCELTLKDGVVIRNNNNLQGGAIAVFGTMTMDGGLITGNASGGHGGGVNVQAVGEFTMNGGTITENTATGDGGGGVGILGAGKFTMTGGTITKNTSGKTGGGVNTANANSVITLIGGTIKDNTCGTTGKDMQVMGTYRISGAAYVGSVYLAAGKTVEITGELTAEGLMEITLPDYAEGYTVLAGESALIGASYEQFTVPSDSGYAIGEDGKLFATGEVPIEYVARILQANGEYTYYSSLQAAMGAVPGDGTETRVELLKDITVSTRIEIPANGNRNIILTTAEGSHTITRGVAGRMLILYTGNRLTIQGDGEDTLTFDGANLSAGADQQLIAVGTGAAARDCELILGDGVVIQNNKNNAGGAVIVFGTMTMNGGLITKNTSNAHGGGVNVQGSGEFTMNGGTITENTSTGDGGGGVGILAAGKFTMTGGSIIGNTASKSGGGVNTANANSVITLTGGTIKDNTCGTTGKDVQVLGTYQISGAAYVGSAYLAAGKTVEITGEVTADGVMEIKLPDYTEGYTVLTGDQALIEAAHEKFAVPEDCGYVIGSDGKLAEAEKEPEPDYAVRIQVGNGEYSYYDSLQDALEAVPGDGTETRVELLKDITVSARIEIPANGNRSIILTTAEGSHTITRALAGRLLILHTGNKLTIQGNGKDTLTFDGANLSAGADQQLIAVGTGAAARDCELILKDGVVIRNNNNLQGGAVIVFGTMTMDGGMITGNTSGGHGGGVNLQGSGEFTMNGGAIFENTATGDGGGGVGILGAGKFTMTGGTIHENTSGKTGGGVNTANANSVITLTGGMIKDNTCGTTGKDVQVMGAYRISGAAYVGSVYLAAGKTIEIAGEVTADGVMEITRPSYAEGDTVLTGDQALIEAAYVRFAVPEDCGFVIGEDGKLTEAEEEPDAAVRVQVDGGEYSYYDSLREALAAVPDDGKETRVEVLKDITVMESIEIPADGNRNIILTTGKGAHTITRGFTGGRMLILHTGNTLTIEGNDKDVITIDGGGLAAGANQQLICVGTSANDRDCELILKDGVVIQNNNNNAGGTVMVFGTMTMDGGTITGNTTGAHGSGVNVQASGAFTMNGGTICENHNTGDGGGGVGILGAGKFTMTGGSIVNNTASKTGGGVNTANANSVITLTGGTIKDNTCGTTGKDVQVLGTYRISGEAYVGSIRLAAGKTVEITGELTTTEGVMEITRPNYAAGDTVLTGDLKLIAASYERFKVPAGTGYAIGADGKLVTAVGKNAVSESVLTEVVGMVLRKVLEFGGLT